MTRPVTYIYPAVNNAYIAAVQSRVGAGNMIFNGTFPADVNGVITFPRFARTISLTSGNNNSAVNFTINGFQDGASFSETIAGPNANTVSTATLFDVVESITSDGNINAVSAGIGVVGRTAWLINDYNRTVYNSSFIVVISAAPSTITYSYETTIDNVEEENPANIQSIAPIANMTNAVVSASSSSDRPCFACCVSVSASTLGGSLRFTFLQQGIR